MALPSSIGDDPLYGASREDMAYCAGFFDGEGCVNISKVRVKAGTGSLHEGNSVEVKIGNTNHAALKFIQSIFGGTITPVKPTPVRKRSFWVWQARSQKAATFLRRVMPFLIVKKLEAEIAIAMQDVIEQSKHRRHEKGKMGPPPLSAEELANRESFRLRLLSIRNPDRVCN